MRSLTYPQCKGRESVSMMAIKPCITRTRLGIAIVRARVGLGIAIVRARVGLGIGNKARRRRDWRVYGVMTTVELYRLNVYAIERRLRYFVVFRLHNAR